MEELMQRIDKIGIDRATKDRRPGGLGAKPGGLR